MSKKNESELVVVIDSDVTTDELQKSLLWVSNMLYKYGVGVNKIHCGSSHDKDILKNAIKNNSQAIKVSESFNLDSIVSDYKNVLSDVNKSKAYACVVISKKPHEYMSDIVTAFENLIADSGIKLNLNVTNAHIVPQNATESNTVVCVDVSGSMAERSDKPLRVNLSEYLAKSAEVNDYEIKGEELEGMGTVVNNYSGRTSVELAYKEAEYQRKLSNDGKSKFGIVVFNHMAKLVRHYSNVSSLNPVDPAEIGQASGGTDILAGWEVSYEELKANSSSSDKNRKITLVTDFGDNAPGPDRIKALIKNILRAQAEGIETELVLVDPNSAPSMQFLNTVRDLQRSATALKRLGEVPRPGDDVVVIKPRPKMRH